MNESDIKSSSWLIQDSQQRASLAVAETEEDLDQNEESAMHAPLLRNDVTLHRGVCSAL